MNTPNTKPTLLIVDDMPENLALLGEVLRPSYQIRVANSGPRALEVAGRQPVPDLILLDVMMPGMDGHQVLRELRANPVTAEVPVIFVTAMDSVEDEIRGLDLGAVDYITKPIVPALVLTRVHTQLELKQARDWLRDQNAFLDAEVRRRMAENQHIQDISIRALACLAEIRDLETGNHLRRTQGYIEALANYLKDRPRFASTLTRDYIDLLIKSAPLHDIGKVGIPDHILLKPGRLTEDEFKVMKRHPILGYEAIEQAEKDEGTPVAFLQVAKEVVLNHHEKWDGSGYPQGLAGEGIPVSARLMALADVFDALISRRIYKAPMPLDKAAAIIEEGRGSHFDPDIVDAFVALRSEFEAIAERFADSQEAVEAKLNQLDAHQL